MDAEFLKTKTSLIKYRRSADEVVKIILQAEVEPPATTGPGRPKDFSIQIRDVNEKAYQRAIWLSGRSSFVTLQIEWIDLEMPVVPHGSSRRECLDVIGVAGDSIVIAELKDEGGDSPLFALYEAVKYTRSIERFKDQLAYHGNARSHLPGAGLSKFSAAGSVNIIAAPKSYWDDFRRLDVLPSLEDAIRRVSGALGVRIHAAQFPDEDFTLQRGSAEGYIPKVLNNPELKWEQVI